jgi:two-component system LytT family response regulator
MKIKVAIIDDENHGIKAMEHLLGKHCPEVDIVFTTNQSTKAKSLLELHKPDLIFLDIEMPLMNGIELLQQFNPIPFKVIFTTAYDQYAIKAIRLNALDYLLKPVDKIELRLAVDEYINSKVATSVDQVQQLEHLQKSRILDTLALSTQQGLHFVKLADIMLMEAVSCYTNIILKDGTKHLVSKTLAVLEEVLQDDPSFFRPHKSSIVNLQFIKQYIRGEGGEIVLQNDTRISISRNKKQEFLAMFTKV